MEKQQEKVYTIQGRLPERIITLVIPEKLREQMDGDDFREMITKCAADIEGVQAVCDGVAQWKDMGENYAESDPIYVEVRCERIMDTEVTIEGEEEWDEDEWPYKS